MQHENSQRTKRQERTFHSQRPHAPPLQCEDNQAKAQAGKAESARRQGAE